MANKYIVNRVQLGKSIPLQTEDRFHNAMFRLQLIIQQCNGDFQWLEPTTSAVELGHLIGLRVGPYDCYSITKETDNDLTSG